MFNPSFQAPVFLDNTDLKSYKSRVDILKKKVYDMERKVMSVRKYNSDLQIEKLRFPKKKEFSIDIDYNGIIRDLNSRIEEIELKNQMCESTENYYNRIIGILKNKKSQRGPKIKKKPMRISTPLDNTFTRMSCLKKYGIKGLPPLSLTRFLQQTDPKVMKKMKSIFGTNDPELIFNIMVNNKVMNKNLKKMVDVSVKIEDLMCSIIRNYMQNNTHVSKLKEKHKSLKIDILENKIKLFDLKNSRIPSKINDILNLISDDSSHKTPLESIEDITSYVYIIKRQNEREVVTLIPKDIINSSTIKLSQIPTLSLSSIGGSESFLPGTRSTRRAFSSLSRRGSEYIDSDNEICSFGQQLGSVYIDRFAFLYKSFDKPISVIGISDPVIPHPPDEIYKYVDNDLVSVLNKMLQLYNVFYDILHLSFYDDSDVMANNQRYYSFLGSRDTLIGMVVDFFSFDIILSFFNKHIKDDAPTILWIIRDLLLYSDMCNFLGPIIDFVEKNYIFCPDRLVLNNNEIVVVLGVLSSFFETDTLNLFHNRILLLLSESLLHQIEDEALSPSGLKNPIIYVGSLLVGKYCPEKFSNYLTIQNQYTSILHRYIRNYLVSHSIIQISSDFLTASLSFLDDESIIWHFSIFHHYSIIELSKDEIHETFLSNYLSVLSSISTIRRNKILKHIETTYLLQNFIKQIDIETNPNMKRIFERKIQQTNFSYKDIPSLSLSSAIPSLNLDNPKLQLHFQGFEDNKTQSPTPVDAAYDKKLAFYPVYQSKLIHIQIIELLFSIIIDSNSRKLDVRFVDPFPHINRKPNVLFPLMKHIEASKSEDIVNDYINKLRKSAKMSYSGSSPRITSFLSQNSINEDHYRLLRLTMPCLFHPEKYSNGTHIASGAFGVVMSVSSPNGKLAVKILKKSQSEYDNPHLFEVFTEVSILESCINDRRVTQLIDYGCTTSSYYIVMEFYPFTLKSWRKQFIEEFPSVSTLLRLYYEVLMCATVLHDKKINHFDIKCDNIMLDFKGYPSLADFGESMRYSDEKNCNTLLNKGTEWIKSPEMLSIALNSTQENPNYDRRKQQGAGPQSDVWSIGCLLYEIITGKFLFSSNDWSVFFMRVTDPNEPILTEENCLILNNDKIAQFIEFVLQRSVHTRPSLQQVIKKFDDMFPEAKNSPLPIIYK